MVTLDKSTKFGSREVTLRPSTDTPYPTSPAHFTASESSRTLAILVSLPADEAVNLIWASSLQHLTAPDPFPR